MSETVTKKRRSRGPTVRWDLSDDGTIVKHVKGREDETFSLGEDLSDKFYHAAAVEGTIALLSRGVSFASIVDGTGFPDRTAPVAKVKAARVPRTPRAPRAPKAVKEPKLRINDRAIILARQNELIAELRTRGVNITHDVEAGQEAVATAFWKDMPEAARSAARNLQSVKNARKFITGKVEPTLSLADIVAANVEETTPIACAAD